VNTFHAILIGVAAGALIWLAVFLAAWALLF
jgi:hypothetical protein